MDMFGTIPPNLKPCQNFLRLAADHDKVDPVISYWCRLHALQLGLKIDSKDKNNLAFLRNVMVWLEEEKIRQSENEAITDEIVAQAHVENYAMKLFVKADSDDRAGRASKNTSILFLKVSQLFDAMAVFGDLSDDVIQKSKYSKWRAAYISKCIKNGETPLPPETEESTNEDNLDQASPRSPSSHTEDANSDRFESNFTVDLSRNLPDSSAGSTASSTTSSYSHQPASTPASFQSIDGNRISHEDILKSQKYCKWAGSALQFEDIPTAVMNLQKALCLLTTGKELNI